MKYKNYVLHSLKYRKWFQLGLSLFFALFLFLIPITAGTGLRLSLKLSPRTVELSLPWGVELVHATGGLTITKSAPTFVGQGQAITYTLTITNHTGQPLTDGQVVDPLPNNVDESSCQAIQAPTNWVFLCDGGLAAWAFAQGFSQPIPNGGVVNLLFKVNTTTPLTSGDQIVNDDYQISVPNLGFSDTGPAVTTTIVAPIWSITKTVSSATIQPGQNLIYTITATNIGQAATSGAYTITDILPNDTTLVSPGSLSWSFTTPLAPSASRSVNFTVKANSPLPNGLKIVNDGYTVSGGGASTAAVNDPITVTVNSPSTLSISKVASADPATVNQILRYTITLTNTATTGPAQNVVITDILPAEVTFQSASSGGVHSNGVVVWTLPGSIAPNSSTQVSVTGTVTTTLPQPPVITNNYQASATNATPVSGAKTIGVKAGAPAKVNLVVSPSSISLCGTTVATSTVTDNFDNPIPGVNVEIFTGGPGGVLDPSTASGLTNASGKFVTQFQGIEDGPGLVNLVAIVPNLPAGGTSVTINSPAIPSNLTLTASPNPLVTGGNTAVVTATLTDCTATPKPVAGQTVNFALSNPALATFSGPVSGVTNANGVVTTTLTSNSTPLAGTLTMTGTSGSVTGTTTLNILQPNTPLLNITKSATPPSGSKVETGGTIVYTVTVANNGTGVATGLTLTDDLSSAVDFVAGTITTGTGPSVLAGNVISFSITSLGIGASSTATLSVTVTSAVSGTIFSNLAMVQSGGTFPIASNVVTHTVVTATIPTGSRQYLPLLYKE